MGGVEEDGRRLAGLCVQVGGEKECRVGWAEYSKWGGGWRGRAGEVTVRGRRVEQAVYDEGGDV